MTSICRKVLNSLRKLARNEKPEFIFLERTTHISLAFKCSVYYDYSQYCDEITGIIGALVDDGYLQYGSDQCSFMLTHKGLHPHLVQWEVIKHFLLVSVAVPIAVSVITTLLTLWLKTL